MQLPAPLQLQEFPEDSAQPHPEWVGRSFTNPGVFDVPAAESDKSQYHDHQLRLPSTRLLPPTSLSKILTHVETLPITPRLLPPLGGQQRPRPAQLRFHTDRDSGPRRSPRLVPQTTRPRPPRQTTFPDPRHLRLRMSKTPIIPEPPLELPSPLKLRFSRYSA